MNNIILEKIDDITKHMFILFESSQSCEYHKSVYEELHMVIDKISYDILVLTGKIPTVNLISHSRGGITSIMYASGLRKNGKIANVNYKKGDELNNDDGDYINIGDGIYEKVIDYNEKSEIINDHPFNVKGLFSIGTPYKGTKWNSEILNGLAHDIVPEFFSNYSAKNILDETIQKEINECWENATKINPTLMLNAIAGTFDLSFLIGLLSEDYQKISIYLSGNDLNLYIKLFEEWINKALDILDIIKDSIDLLNAVSILIPFFGFLTLLPTTLLSIGISSVEVPLRMAIDSLNEFRNNFHDQLVMDNIPNQTIFSELAYILKDYVDAIELFCDFIEQFDGDYNLNVVGGFGDLFIDTESQLAEGFSNVIRHNKTFKYENIDFTTSVNNEVVITGSSRNFEYKRCINDVAIPHNLETNDYEIINYIYSNIDMGIPSTIYNFDILEDDSIKITGYTLPNYYYSQNLKLKEEFRILQLSLPTEINGKNITQIDDYAFKDLSLLVSIKLSNGIKNIHDNSFENCTNLINITLPDTLIYIGNSTFKGCTNLTSIEIPNSVTNIGISTFENCINLSEVTLPDNLSLVRQATFRNCVSLNNVILPNNIIGIESYAFSGCTNLNNIVLSNQLDYISTYSFKDCSQLENVIIPENVESIYGCAFENCRNLSEVVFLDNTNPVTNIENDTFNNCDALTSIIVPYNKLLMYRENYGFTDYKDLIFPDQDLSYAIIDCNGYYDLV